MEIKQTRVLIAGLGLIGGSVAKALKEYGLNNIYAYDHNESTLIKAENSGVIKKGLTCLTDDIEPFDFVLCCLSPAFVVPLYKEAEHLMKQYCVFAEVGGIKTVVTKELSRVMNPSHKLLSLHPMAGSEKIGYDYSSKDMFVGSVLVMTQCESANETVFRWANLLKNALGCKKLVELSAQKHDKIIAHVSQVPHVVALAIKAMYKGGTNEQYAGGSYKSATRVAKINSALWAGLMSDNKKYLLSSIGEFKKQLSLLEQAIETGDKDKLERLLDEMSGKAEV